MGNVYRPLSKRYQGRDISAVGNSEVKDCYFPMFISDKLNVVENIIITGKGSTITFIDTNQKFHHDVIDPNLVDRLNEIGLDALDELDLDNPKKFELVKTPYNPRQELS